MQCPRCSVPSDLTVCWTRWHYVHMLEMKPGDSYRLNRAKNGRKRPKT